MASQVIRTKWHMLEPLIKKDQVYMLAPPNGGLSRHWSEYKPIPEIFVRALNRPMPKFVIDAELMEITSKKEFHQSMLDMKKANVLRLPFEQMAVEFSVGKAQTFVLMADLQSENTLDRKLKYLVDEITKHGNIRPEFLGYTLQLQHDEDGDYLVISPGMHFISLREKDGEPHMHSVGVVIDAFKNADSPNIDVLMNAVNNKATSNCAYGLFGALLLMSTAGVERETIEVERLNKKRVLSNKPPIPSHTYIRIGHVYRSAKSDVSDVYIARKSPRPHWRRGHIRHVRYGVGHNQIRTKYIYPKLVAFHGDEYGIKQPEYTVVK